MFLNTYVHTVDEKGRVAVPARYREQLPDGVIITLGEEDCLIALPLREFESYAAQIYDYADDTPEGRDKQRALTRAATECELDSHGRIALPANLRAMVGIGSEVIFVGVYRRFELWSTEQWDKKQAELMNRRTAKSSPA